MDFDYFLVKWVRENPMRHTIMSRNDISEEGDRKKSGIHLVGKEINFKWKRSMCVGQIRAFGCKKDMEIELQKEINASRTVKPCSSTGSVENIQGKKRNNTANLNKRSKLDEIVQLVENQVENGDKDEIIQQLRDELNLERELRILAESKYEELQKSMDNQTAITDDRVDIGNGVLVHTQTLRTMRTVSSTVSIYARNIFKLLFEIHEIVGRSLTGKGCNANKGAEKLPSIDPIKRDAIIDHALQTFGKKPGSDLYKHGLKDLKQSLSCLIREMVKEANDVESILQPVRVQNENN